MQVRAYVAGPERSSASPVSSESRAGVRFALDGRTHGSNTLECLDGRAPIGLGAACWGPRDRCQYTAVREAMAALGPPASPPRGSARTRWPSRGHSKPCLRRPGWESRPAASRPARWCTRIPRWHGWRTRAQRRRKRRSGPTASMQCDTCLAKSTPATPAPTARSVLRTCSCGQPASGLDRSDLTRHRVGVIALVTGR
jgi:hypothetical protein